ncbi:hypothetical protein J8Z24_21585 (plasmid) [Pseudoalteromonas sp. SCSIO 43201]|uniref:hypothetical protein n=1 Tax=Pseudoalteromonas TaxID=53246 RepID=UPI0020764820|nr:MULTISPECIES: hypothetical protein [Pseudoalteromonas]MDW7551286.1 hypothetical protein [Pseudoalteromonas peptidolytica]USD31104.1 hypothetical protein J8Z24_21585 [Pseudoalteromonas sp. SCSIO 43201]
MANIAVRHIDKLRQSNALSLPNLGDVTTINSTQPSGIRIFEPRQAQPQELAVLAKRLQLAFARFKSPSPNTRQANTPISNGQSHPTLTTLPKNTATGLINAVVRGLTVQLQALNLDELKTAQHNTGQSLQNVPHALNIDKLLQGQDLSIEALRATMKMLGPMIKAFNAKQQSDHPILVQDIARQYSAQLQLSKDQSQRAQCHSALDLLSQNAAADHAQLNVLTHMDSTLTELASHIKAQSEKQQKQSQQSRALKSARRSSDLNNKEDNSDTTKDKASLFNIDKKELFKVALGTVGLDDLPELVNFDALFTSQKGAGKQSSDVNQVAPNSSTATVAKRASQAAVMLAPTDTAMMRGNTSSTVISTKAALIDVGTAQSTFDPSVPKHHSQNKNTRQPNSEIQSRSQLPVSAAKAAVPTQQHAEETHALLNAALRSLSTQLQAIAKINGTKSSALTSVNIDTLLKGQRLETHSLRQLLSDCAPLISAFNQQQKSTTPITQGRMTNSYKEMLVDAPKPQQAILQTLIKQSTSPRPQEQIAPPALAKLNILGTVNEAFARLQTQRVTATRQATKPRHKPQVNREASNRRAEQQSILNIDKHEWLRVALGTLGLDDLPNILDLKALFSGGNPKTAKLDKRIAKPQNKSLAKRVMGSVTELFATRQPPGNTAKSTQGQKAIAPPQGRVKTTALLGGITASDVNPNASVSTKSVAAPKTLHLNNAQITIDKGSTLVIQGDKRTSAAHQNIAHTNQQRANQARTSAQGKQAHQKRARQVKANRTTWAAAPTQSLAKLATEYLPSHVTHVANPDKRPTTKQSPLHGRMSLRLLSGNSKAPTRSNTRPRLATTTGLLNKYEVITQVASLFGASLAHDTAKNAASHMDPRSTRIQGQQSNITGRLLNLGASLFAEQKESLSELNQTLRLFKTILPKDGSADNLLGNLLDKHTSKREKRTNRKRNGRSNKARPTVVKRLGTGRSFISTLSRGASAAVSGIASLATGGMAALSGAPDTSHKKAHRREAKPRLGSEVKAQSRRRKTTQGKSTASKALSHTSKSISSRLPSMKGLGRAVLGGAKLVPIAGQALTAGLALLDGAAGWQRADENFALQANEKASTGQKVASAAGSILSGISFGQLDEGNTARTLYDVGSKVVNLGSHLFSGLFSNDPQGTTKSSKSQSTRLIKAAAIPLTMMTQPHTQAATTPASGQMMVQQHIPTHSSRVHTAAKHEQSKEKREQTEVANLASSLQIDTKTSIPEPLNDQVLRKDTLSHVVNTQATAKKLPASSTVKPVSASRKSVQLNRPASRSTPAQSSFGIDDYGIAIMNSILFD